MGEPIARSTLSAMRIVSLVPSATEMLFAIGAGDEVVAVTHECDHPPEAADLPHVTRSRIPRACPPARSTRPCASTPAGPGDLRARRGVRGSSPTSSSRSRSARSARSPPTTCGRSPSAWRPVPTSSRSTRNTLGEVLGDVRTLAQATDRSDEGGGLVQDAANRIDGVRLAVRDAERLRVAALEWLDPIYVAGHWTPQLIEYAGGVDLLGMPGGPRRGPGRRSPQPSPTSCRHALRLRRRPRVGGGAGLPRAACHARRAGNRGGRRRGVLHGPGRGSSTGWSCSATCCTPASCPRRQAAG